MNFIIRTAGCLTLLFLLPTIAVYPQHSVFKRHKTPKGEKNKEQKKEAEPVDPSLDDLLQRIENAHLIIDQINTRGEAVAKTTEIQRRLPSVQASIKTIQENLLLFAKTPDPANLQTYQVLLDDVMKELSTWRTTLVDYNKDLTHIQSEMVLFSKTTDTVMKQLSIDSSYHALYASEIEDLTKKWTSAKVFVAHDVTLANNLLAVTSASYFSAVELDDMTDEQMRYFWTKALRQEQRPLWEASVRQKEDNPSQIDKATANQGSILNYYFERNWTDQILTLCIALLFFIWVSFNFHQIDKYQKADNTRSYKIEAQPTICIGKWPWVPAWIVFFSIEPFFNLHAPSLYFELSQAGLLISLTVFFWFIWPKKLFIMWTIVALLYILFSYVHSLPPGFIMRLGLIGLNVFAMLTGILFLRRYEKGELSYATIRVLLFVFVFTHGGAILANLAGLLSLSRVVSSSITFGLIQGVGFSAMIQILIEAFHLQMHRSRIRHGITHSFSFDRIGNRLYLVLLIAAISGWLVTLAYHLNIFDYLNENIQDFLAQPRTVGNITFSLANLIIFFLIIIVSNLLQKYIGYFFGETEEDLNLDTQKRGSRFVVMRLILLVLGVLLAVAASGLPIDRITIILGALGVGIGLGLQNIVNNLVSGIILIFERPFQIGDLIEVGTKKGRVKDIGIRASHLVTTEGSEIIVPNGDLLSGQVVNWTLTDNSVRLSLPIKVDPTTDVKQVSDIISKEVGQIDGVLKNMPVEILLAGISTASIDLNILVWVDNIHKELEVKSALIITLYAKLKASGIKIV